MRNEHAKYTADWVSVKGGASVALSFLCALPAPFIAMDQTMAQNAFIVT